MTGVCFLVHNDPAPGAPDSAAYRIYGVRYNTTPVGPDSIAVVLHSGGGHPWWYWDHDENVSVAKGLARAGYVVFAYDRLGYFDSRPADLPLMFYAQPMHIVEMSHEVIQQVSDGTYDVEADRGCPQGGTPAGTPHSRVVGIGQSLGGGIVSSLAQRYPDDLDAVLPGEFSNRPLINPLFAVALAKAGPTMDERGLVTFPVETEDCLDVIFYMPGVDPAIPPRYCDPVLEHNAPFGEFDGIATVFSDDDLDAIRADMPVLFVWADHSYAFDEASQQAMYDHWRADCACAAHVEQFRQADSGHDFNLHRSAPSMVARTVEWLAANGLAPATG